MHNKLYYKLSMLLNAKIITITCSSGSLSGKICIVDETI